MLSGCMRGSFSTFSLESIDALTSKAESTVDVLEMFFDAGSLRFSSNFYNVDASVSKINSPTYSGVRPSSLYLATTFRLCLASPNLRLA